MPRFGEQPVTLPTPLPMVEHPQGAGSVLYSLPGWQVGGFATYGLHVSFSSVLAVPIYVARETTFDRMGIRIVNGVTAAKLGMGVYASLDNGFGIAPGALLVRAPMLTVAVNNTFEETIFTDPLTIGPGHFFVAGSVDLGAVTCRIPSATALHGVPVTGEGFASDVTGGQGLERILQLGSNPAAPVLPDPFGAVISINLLSTNQVGYGFWLGRTIP